MKCTNLRLPYYRLTISVFSMKSKLLPSPRGQMGKAYPVFLRTAVLRDYLSGMSRSDVALKYSLPDCSILSHWKHNLTNVEDIKTSTSMVKRRNKPLLRTDSESVQSKRNQELERALSQCQKVLSEKADLLKKANLHVLVSGTMIELTEEESSISIRKNFGSKSEQAS